MMQCCFILPCVKKLLKCLGVRKWKVFLENNIFCFLFVKAKSVEICRKKIKFIIYTKNHQNFKTEAAIEKVFVYNDIV